jgi:hypothetical protein
MGGVCFTLIFGASLMIASAFKSEGPPPLLDMLEGYLATSPLAEIFPGVTCDFKVF